MNRFQFKTVTLKKKGGIFRCSKVIPGLEQTLNDHGEQGWQLKSTIMPSDVAGFGVSSSVILIFERPKAVAEKAQNYSVNLDRNQIPRRGGV